MSANCTSRPRRPAGLLGGVLASVCMLAATAAADQRYAVPHAVSPRLRAAELVDAADPDESLPMSIMLQLRQRDELAALITAQQQPGSPQYHQWLTPHEFTARFAPEPAEYAALADWLERQGFAVHRWPSRVRLDFAGPVAAAERAFSVHINRYRHRGRQVVANADAPLLPVRFQNSVAVVRLNTLPLAEPMVRLFGSHGHVDTLSPDDVARVYDAQPVLDRGIDGAGQTIAVVARADFHDTDVTSFQQQFGTVVRAPVKVFPGANPGIGAAQGNCQQFHDQQTFAQCTRLEEGEVLLDTQWAAALAPGATVLVDIASDIDVSLMDVVAHHPEATVINVSFGDCERLDKAALQVFAPVYAQAATQGQTVVVATGDLGADGCNDGKGASVNGLASDANVTAVGGTTLNPGFDANGDATAHVGESVWNDATGATGGGPSVFVPKPPYQVAPGVPNDGKRDQPDVALPASPNSPGYVIVEEGGLALVGGTSVATPAWAGIVALVNQAAQPGGSGALNHALYPLAQQQYAENGPSVFFDVTTGNNDFNHVRGYAAGVGYDLVTGLGTPDVAQLVRALAPVGCAGDCNTDGTVTINELIAGVNIAQNTLPLAACAAMDTNYDGQITIDEIIAATNRALGEC